MRFISFGEWEQSVTLGLLSSPLVGGGEGYRPYFENYTVDASIFGPILRGWFMKMILKIISQFFDDSNSM